jgi:head-tail adaptor
MKIVAFGKMNQFIDIVEAVSLKDSDGFVTQKDNIIASVRAYKEDRYGSERWANRAAFTTATAMFRFRKIPNVTIDATHVIVWLGNRYHITSAEDVKNRGMYIECLAEFVTGSMR